MSSKLPTFYLSFSTLSSQAFPRYDSHRQVSNPFLVGDLDLLEVLGPSDEVLPTLASRLRQAAALRVQQEQNPKAQTLKAEQGRRRMRTRRQGEFLASDLFFLTLNVSKDDFLFGVQSVDMEGNASPVSIPLPQRWSA